MKPGISNICIYNSPEFNSSWFILSARILFNSCLFFSFPPSFNITSSSLFFSFPPSFNFTSSSLLLCLPSFSSTYYLSCFDVPSLLFTSVSSSTNTLTLFTAFSSFFFLLTYFFSSFTYILSSFFLLSLLSSFPSIFPF